jgi:hypothetical protein
MNYDACCCSFVAQSRSLSKRFIGFIRTDSRRNHFGIQRGFQWYQLLRVAANLPDSQEWEDSEELDLEGEHADRRTLLGQQCSTVEGYVQATATSPIADFLRHAI